MDILFFMRHIIIGDVHGCINEFSTLLNKLQITNEDKLFSVGDLVDKGPDPIGCIRLAKEMNITTVRGNHEDKPIRWLLHEQRCKITKKKNPMSSVSEEEKEIYSKLNEDDVNWLCSLPTAYKLEELNTIIVHGGFFPGVDIDFQIKNRIREVIRLRFVDEHTGNFVSVSNADQPPNTLLWSKVYDGSYNIVYGHITHDLKQPRVDVRERDKIECVGIDTGCVTGGMLTAYILESKSFVQVPATKQYCKCCWSE